MTSDECLSCSDRFDTRQNALRPKRGLLLQCLLIHRLKNLAHCVGLGGLTQIVNVCTPQGCYSYCTRYYEGIGVVSYIARFLKIVCDPSQL